MYGNVHRSSSLAVRMDVAARRRNGQGRARAGRQRWRIRRCIHRWRLIARPIGRLADLDVELHEQEFDADLQVLRLDQPDRTEREQERREQEDEDHVKRRHPRTLQLWSQRAAKPPRTALSLSLAE